MSKKTMQKILINFLYRYRGEVKDDWAYINTEKRKMYLHKDLAPILKRKLKQSPKTAGWEVVQISYIFRPCQ